MPQLPQLPPLAQQILFNAKGFETIHLLWADGGQSMLFKLNDKWHRVNEMKSTLYSEIPLVAVIDLSLECRQEGGEVIRETNVHTNAPTYH